MAEKNNLFNDNELYKIIFQTNLNNSLDKYKKNNKNCEKTENNFYSNINPNNNINSKSYIV